MPETIAIRLKEASETCAAAHAAWLDNKQDAAIKEALQGAAHELRRIAARLEIDIAHADSSSKPRRQHDNNGGHSGGGQKRNRKPRPKKDEKKEG